MQLCVFSTMLLVYTVLCDTHSGSYPLHTACFGGVWRELLEAQRLWHGGKAGVLKQPAALHTLSLQLIVVLVQELDCVVIASHPLSLQALLVDTRRHSSD